MRRRALHTRPRVVAVSSLAAMSLCVACTTTLDPTLSVESADASLAGAAGAETQPAPVDLTPQSVSDCSALAGADRQYLVCDHMRSFSEAVVDCQSGGATVIKVDTPAETELLKTVLSGKQWGWLGASRNDSFDWTWLDGTPFWHGDASGSAEPGAYTNWQTGEPDNTSQTVRNEERCGTFDIATATWVDRYCELLLPYVCELPPGVMP